MKTLLLMLTLFTALSASNAAIFHVALDGSTMYQQVQPAINAAVDGDTIIVAPGFGYAGFSIDKQLVIIGAGTSSLGDEATQIAGVIVVSGNASNTMLNGIWVRANVWNYAVVQIMSGTGHRIIRCFVENVSSERASGVFLSANTSADIEESVLLADTPGLNWAVGNDVSAHVNVSNCIICNFSLFATGDVSATVTFRQCIFLGGTGLYLNSPVVVENCATIGTNSFVYNAPNAIIRYSIANVDTSNFVHYDPADLRLSDFHLRPNSTLRDTGNPFGEPDLDGSRADIGIYGGLHPYVENGIPDFPFTLSLQADSSVSQNGALRVLTRGRVGPGN